MADTPDEGGLARPGPSGPPEPGHRPPRGYSWAPFEPGNLVPLRHGAHSPRVVDPLATELVDRVLDDPDTRYLTAPSYRPALWSWGRAEARVQLLTEYLARLGDEAGDGVGDLDSPRVLAAYRLLAEAERSADRGRARLGLDPLSRARLGRDVAAAQVDVADLLTRLREQAEKGAGNGAEKAEEGRDDDG